MIDYISQNQISLDLFEHPFEKNLDKENRWVKLSGLVPWDELASVYCTKLETNRGRKSINIRTVIAALIVKHKLCLDDRGTIQMIQENVYLQFFCGLKVFTTKKVFDPSLFVDIRKRLGNAEFDKFNQFVIDKSEQIKPHQSRIKKQEVHGIEKDTESCSGDSPKPKNKGTLKVDATVADQEITYPTDLKLLNKCREELERIFDLLYIHHLDKNKPKTYRRNARKEFINISKKKRKSKKEIRRGVKSQLQYVSRDIRLIQQFLIKPGRAEALGKKDLQLYDTIRKVYDQQKWMYDNNTNKCDHRIVNLYQPHVRPMVRGKEKTKTEFGSKINVGEVNGFCRIDRLSWDAYNEGGDVEMQAENFRKVYGCYPKWFLGDKIYLTQKNRKFLKTKGIEIVGKPLGRPSTKNKETASQKYRKKKKAAQRNHIEGKFGQAKRGYGLNNIKSRLRETSESWINSIIFVMNLTKLLQIAEKFGYVFGGYFKSMSQSLQVFPKFDFWLKGWIGRNLYDYKLRLLIIDYQCFREERLAILTFYGILGRQIYQI